MTDDCNSVVPEHLHAVRADLDAIRADMLDIKRLLTSIEGSGAGMRDLVADGPPPVGRDA